MGRGSAGRTHSLFGPRIDGGAHTQLLPKKEVRGQSHCSAPLVPLVALLISLGALSDTFSASFTSDSARCSAGFARVIDALLRCASASASSFFAFSRFTAAWACFCRFALFSVFSSFFSFCLSSCSLLSSSLPSLSWLVITLKRWLFWLLA